MNLHALAGPIIAAVNPTLAATLRVSTGNATGPSGRRTPTYADVSVTAQVQPLSGLDLKQLDSLNLNGAQRAIYLYGIANATVRVSQKGGDLVVLATGGPNDGVWLTTQVLEQWPDWVKVAVTLQEDAP